jgi:hypothetical protein
MTLTRRDRWAILYASLIFGAISTPYVYLGGYAVQGFFLPFEYADLFWLPLSTALLLGVFIARRSLEKRLADGLGWLFPLLLAALLLAAAGDLMYLTLLLVVQFLSPLAEGWVGVIGITAIASMLVAIFVVVRPPSRLEQVIAMRLGAANSRHRLYRAAGHIALLGGLAFATYWFRQYYLYEHYCVGYIEPQDYIDCEFWH